MNIYTAVTHGSYCPTSALGEWRYGITGEAYQEPVAGENFGSQYDVNQETMALTAVRWALSAINRSRCPYGLIIVKTKSAYVYEGLSLHLRSWNIARFRDDDQNRIPDAELWEQVDTIRQVLELKRFAVQVEMDTSTHLCDLSDEELRRHEIDSLEKAAQAKLLRASIAEQRNDAHRAAHLTAQAREMQAQAKAA